MLRQALNRDGFVRGSFWCLSGADSCSRTSCRLRCCSAPAGPRAGGRREASLLRHPSKSGLWFLRKLGWLARGHLGIPYFSEDPSAGGESLMGVREGSAQGRVSFRLK